MQTVWKESQLVNTPSQTVKNRHYAKNATRVWIVVGAF